MYVIHIYIFYFIFIDVFAILYSSFRFSFSFSFLIHLFFNYLKKLSKYITTSTGTNDLLFHLLLNMFLVESRKKHKALQEVEIDKKDFEVLAASKGIQDCRIFYNSGYFTRNHFIIDEEAKLIKKLE